jgi:hypothetical protein
MQLSRMSRERMNSRAYKVISVNLFIGTRENRLTAVDNLKRLSNHGRIVFFPEKSVKEPHDSHLIPRSLMRSRFVHDTSPS